MEENAALAQNAKDPIIIFGPKADGIYIVEFMSVRREVKARAKV